MNVHSTYAPAVIRAALAIETAWACHDALLIEHDDTKLEDQADQSLRLYDSLVAQHKPCNAGFAIEVGQCIDALMVERVALIEGRKQMAAQAAAEREQLAAIAGEETTH